MITEKTVFILGAGSNVQYGFPTGSELREKIIRDFKNIGIRKIFETRPVSNKIVLDMSQGEMQKTAEEFTTMFLNAGTYSIDKWLNFHQKYLKIGILAIILTILRVERSSKFNEEMPKEKRKYDWYQYLFNQMIASLIVKDDVLKFKKNNISFITFNYDRSLEHYLFTCFKNTFFDDDLDFSKIKELFPFKFYHVYGKIAPLKWQDSENGLDYDETNIDYEKYIKNIDIINSSRKDNSDIFYIHHEISSAKKIFFLGFGFAKENIEILDLKDIISDNTEIYATTLGMSKKEKDLITNIISKKTSTYQFLDIDCFSLLHQFL